MLVFRVLPAARRDFAPQKSDVRLLALPRAVAFGVAVGVPPLPRPVVAQQLRCQRSCAPPAQPRRRCSVLLLFSGWRSWLRCQLLRSVRRWGRVRVGRAVRLVRLSGALFCAGGGGAAALLCVLLPPGSRRRRVASPPLRRPRAWSRPCWSCGEGVAALAPAGGCSASGVSGLPLPAALFLVLVSGFPPLLGALSVAPAACLRALVLALAAASGLRLLGCGVLGAGRVPLPPPRPQGAPPFPPSGSPPSGGRPRAEILAGAGGQARALLAQAVGRGAPALAFPRRVCGCPPVVAALLRAPAGCRAVCALPAPLRGGRPRRLVGGVPAVKGGFCPPAFAHRGTARAKRRFHRRPPGGDLSESWRGSRCQAKSTCAACADTKKAPALTKSEG